MNKRIMKKQSTPSKKMLKKLKKLDNECKKTIMVSKLELRAIMAYKARTGLRKHSYVLVSSSTGKLFLVRQEPRLRLDKAKAQDNFGTRAIAHTVRL